MSEASRSRFEDLFPEPTWEIARLFPAQGAWTEEDYLNLNTNRLVEFVDGSLELLPMPTMSHQEIVLYLCEFLRTFASAKGLGKALIAPLPVRLGPGRFREPDILFMLAEHAARMGETFWDGADLVMEVVSQNRGHDLATKRDEYAAAGITEYWIVDPQQARITVLTLAGSEYAVHGEFAPGSEASSKLLPGFSVSVAEVFAAKP